MNVYFSESKKQVVWNDGKVTMLTQLDDDYTKAKHIATQKVDAETMLLLSCCAKATDWKRVNDITDFKQLAPKPVETAEASSTAASA